MEDGLSQEHGRDKDDDYRCGSEMRRVSPLFLRLPVGQAYKKRRDSDRIGDDKQCRGIVRVGTPVMHRYTPSSASGWRLRVRLNFRSPCNALLRWLTT